MKALIIQRRIRLPMFGTWKWSKDDYKVPLVFELDGAVTAELYLDFFDQGENHREIGWDAILQLKFSPPTQKVLKGLSSQSGPSEEVAEYIYQLYEQVFEKFESIARTAGNIKHLLVEKPETIESFFTGTSITRDKVTWWFEGSKEKNHFAPSLKKGRRKINPLFSRSQLITPEKWSKMQRAIQEADYPSEEYIELLRIRSKLEWKQKKVATIESAILVESILRDYGRQVLNSHGISKSKLKSLKDEMSFSTILNIILPLSLSKTEIKRIETHIKSLDTLRKIRNDVVHGNISEENIDEENVRQGIEGALIVIELLRKKLKNKST